jgi:hypothetical protein
VSAREFEIRKTEIEPKLHPQIGNAQRSKQGVVCVVVIPLPLEYSSIMSQHEDERKNKRWRGR